MNVISVTKFFPSLLVLLCLVQQQHCSVAFVPTAASRRPAVDALRGVIKEAEYHSDRRAVLNRLLLPILGISIVHPIKNAEATLMDNNMEEVKIFSGDNKLTTEEAKSRFKLAIEDVDELLVNYSDIIKSGGGDNVRRYLGTVGVKSHMYGITKVLKILREEADDIVEFTEASNEFEAYLFQAEGAAYQSLFTEHSSAKSTPESLLATAKTDVVSMRKFMGDLARQLNL